MGDGAVHAAHPERFQPPHGGLDAAAPRRTPRRCRQFPFRAGPRSASRARASAPPDAPARRTPASARRSRPLLRCSPYYDPTTARTPCSNTVQRRVLSDRTANSRSCRSASNAGTAPRPLSCAPIRTCIWSVPGFRKVFVASSPQTVQLPRQEDLVRAGQQERHRARRGRRTSPGSVPPDHPLPALREPLDHRPPACLRRTAPRRSRRRPPLLRATNSSTSCGEETLIAHPRASPWVAISSSA